jgi:hypothetical protein
MGRLRAGAAAGGLGWGLIAASSDAAAFASFRVSTAAWW